MKKNILLYTFLLLSCAAFAQNNDPWISFWDKDTTHIGFKDKNGNIKITPKFTRMTSAHKFDGIIAVSEDVKDSWKSYYLTKSGKIVGLDSLYIFDNGPDCENEGFIRFRDPKTDKMGMFNAEGKIVIPAAYSNLTKVRNGLIVALKGAIKKKFDEEHFGWTGGKELLIDITNKVLVENFEYENDYDLNFYSVQKSKEPNKDPARENFQGVNNQYYSFINYDKEFKLWLKNTLLSDLSKENLSNHSFEQITYWKNPNGWIKNQKTTFIDQNYTLLKLKLQELNSEKTDYFISADGLNQFIFKEGEYENYFNNCNESKEWQYPVKNIVISSQYQNDFGQDHFEFLRTENGYKLISVSMSKNNLK